MSAGCCRRTARRIRATGSGSGHHPAIVGSQISMNVVLERRRSVARVQCQQKHRNVGTVPAGVIVTSAAKRRLDFSMISRSPIAKSSRSDRLEKRAVLVQRNGVLLAIVIRRHRCRRCRSQSQRNLRHSALRCINRVCRLLLSCQSDHCWHTRIRARQHPRSLGGS